MVKSSVAGLHLRMPAELLPAEYALHLETSESAQDFATVAVGPSTRTFVAPAIRYAADAVVGDEIKLAGYDAERTADEVIVRLIWQSIVPPTVDAKVFVHLLDADGAIVTQSDSVPASGYNTNRWVEGEVVVDEHRLALPLDLPDTDLRLVAGMYDPTTGLRLAAADSGSIPYPDNAIPLSALPAP